MTFHIFKKWWAWVILVTVALLAAGGGYFFGLVNAYLDAFQEGILENQENITVVRNVPSVISTKEGVSLIRPSNQTFGPENAKLVIVEFGDFQCPFCRSVFPTVRTLMNEYKDSIRFVYRHFPVSDVHSYAVQAAKASLCAGEQGKFWEYHDVLFTNQDRIAPPNFVPFAQSVNINTQTFTNCLSSEKFDQDVENDYNDGIALGVRGTPTFFFNGVKVDGAIPEEAFRQIIGEFLK